MENREPAVGDIFKEGLKRALKVHVPFIIYLAYLLFGVILIGISVIKQNLGFNWQGTLLILMLVIIPAFLVGWLAWLGAKYNYGQ